MKPTWRWPAGMVISGIALAALFLVFPELDLASSAALYQPGHGFVLAGHAQFEFAHRNLGFLTGALAVASLVASLSGPWQWRRPAAFLLLTLVVGPGLIVNGVLKDHWGRARPAKAIEFGGPAAFTPAWVVSDQCGRNCSFVCGDASVGFALVAIAFVSRRPRLWWLAGLTAGGALGVMRMAQGGHYLSDVIFAFYAVTLTAWVLHTMMFRSQAP